MLIFYMQAALIKSLRSLGYVRFSRLARMQNLYPKLPNLFNRHSLNGMSARFSSIHPVSATKIVQASNNDLARFNGLGYFGLMAN